jgi:hypothetical protein
MSIQPTTTSLHGGSSTSICTYIITFYLGKKINSLQEMERRRERQNGKWENGGGGHYSEKPRSIKASNSSCPSTYLNLPERGKEMKGERRGEDRRIEGY